MSLENYRYFFTLGTGYHLNEAVQRGEPQEVSTDHKSGKQNSHHNSIFKAETGRTEISFQHLLESCLQKHICQITLGGYFVVIVRGWIFYYRRGIFSTGHSQRPLGH